MYLCMHACLYVCMYVHICTAMRYGNVKVMGEHILDEREIRQADEEEDDRRRQQSGKKASFKAGAPRGAIEDEGEDMEEAESLFSRKMRQSR